MSESETPDVHADPLAIGVGFDVRAGESIETLELTDTTPWESGVDRVFFWLPYPTLLVSAVLAWFGQPDADERVWSIGLAVAAAVWTALTFSRYGTPTQQRQRTLYVYFAGYLVIATLMMLQTPVFVIYTITGFLHAALLRPWIVMFLALAATSLVVYSTIVYPGGGPVEWSIYLAIVAIQTAAVGLGVYGGERLMEISRERRIALEQLEASRIENEWLQQQLVTQAREAGVHDERERLAGEIHDTIAQGLTGVITQIEAANQTWDDEDTARTHLSNASTIARDSLEDARRSVQALRPSPLEDQRLPEAVAGAAEKWSELTGVPVVMHASGDPVQVPTEIEVTMLRAAQEGLANIGKHANASRVDMTLSFMDGAVALDVRDDGVGFDTTAARRNESYGLTAMQQRVDALDGGVELESSPGEGSVLHVWVPITRRTSDA